MTDSGAANGAACKQLEQVDLMTNLPWKMNLRSAVLLLHHHTPAAPNLRENEALVELPGYCVNAYLATVNAYLATVNAYLATPVGHRACSKKKQRKTDNFSEQKQSFSLSKKACCLKSIRQIICIIGLCLFFSVFFLYFFISGFLWLEFH